MSVQSMLIDNGYTKINSKEYKKMESDLRKASDILLWIAQGVYPCTDAKIGRVLDLLRPYRSLKSDLGNSDIHDLINFLERIHWAEPLVFSKELIAKILMKSIGNFEYNPKYYGYDSGILKRYIITWDSLSRDLNLKNYY